MSGQIRYVVGVAGRLVGVADHTLVIKILEDIPLARPCNTYIKASGVALRMRIIIALISAYACGIPAIVTSEKQAMYMQTW